MCNSSTWNVEARKLKIPLQTLVHNEILSQKQNNRNRKDHRGLAQYVPGLVPHEIGMVM